MPDPFQEELDDIAPQDESSSNRGGWDRESDQEDATVSSPSDWAMSESIPLNSAGELAQTRDATRRETESDPAIRRVAGDRVKAYRCVNTHHDPEQVFGAHIQRQRHR